MRRANVFLFPSLHDEAGWVVLEAFANGLPVICLDVGGPPVLGGTPVRIGRMDATVRRLAEALDRVDELVVRADLPLIDKASRRLGGLISSLGRDDDFGTEVLDQGSDDGS
jgi:glycosyltransferase involved in cell wall biosynthesis